MGKLNACRPLDDIPGRFQCHVSLPWFGFRSGDDTLSRLRQDAYALQERTYPQSRIRKLLRTLSWPVKSLSFAITASGFWAADAIQDGAPSRAGQSAALWWLSLRHNLTYQAYYHFRLWHKRPGVRATDWLDRAEYHLIYQLFRDPHRARILDNKLEFDKFCSRHDLARLPVIAQIQAGGKINWLNKTGRLPAGDLFIKPLDLARGIGAEVFAYDQTTRLWIINGATLNENELLARLCERKDGRDLLVQLRARSHPELQDLSPDVLGTLRCFTYRFRDERAEHFRSVFRMGRSGEIVDHGSKGGIAAAVDENGFLGRPQDRRVGRSVARHPDTGAVIAGRRLPGFHAMLALALRAHDRLGGGSIVAWDIALLESGPVIVEGNSTGSLNLVQATFDEPLGVTYYPEIVIRLIREHEAASERLALDPATPDTGPKLQETCRPIPESARE